MSFTTYNLSTNLQSRLKEAEMLRRRILLTPINPRKKLRLAWESEVERIYWSFSLTDNPLSKADITKTLLKDQKRLSKEQKRIIAYKNALDFIRENWLVEERKITPKTIRDLFDIAIKPTTDNPNISKFNSKAKNIEHLLDYLASGEENPIIQAGIIHIQLLILSPFEDGNGRISRLATYLFLYKNGCDYLDLFCLDEYLRKDLIALKEAVQSVSENQNLTLWLEYFVEGTVVQLKKVVKNLESERFKTETPNSFWKLNERQKKILNLLQNPKEKITNNMVQKMFNISQITASRDLSRLKSLGLLFPHGKGRSIYYTKV